MCRTPARTADRCAYPDDRDQSRNWRLKIARESSAGRANKQNKPIHESCSSKVFRERSRATTSHVETISSRGSILSLKDDQYGRAGEIRQNRWLGQLAKRWKAGNRWHVDLIDLVPGASGRGADRHRLRERSTETRFVARWPNHFKANPHALIMQSLQLEKVRGRQRR